MLRVVFLFLVSLLTCVVASWGETAELSCERTRVPIIYSTDLYHPPQDPDDTYDLATLFALTELDIRAIILDNPLVQEYKRLGEKPLRQMMHLTGREVKWAPGLSDPLTDATDTGLLQPERAKRFQAGVELILSSLRESKEKVVLLSTGSCRDFAAAFNREPGLFQEKVAMLYCVVGTGGDGSVMQSDWNVRFDRWAYFRMFETGVPFYWCGTRPGDWHWDKEPVPRDYSTSYHTSDVHLLEDMPHSLWNFFVYCLTHSQDDPIEFLKSRRRRIASGGDYRSYGTRQMWCTGPLCHAAGREVYRRGPDDYVAMTTEDAVAAGLSDECVKVFDFIPVAVKPTRPPYELKLEYQPRANKPNAIAFHRLVSDARYREIMGSVLRNLLLSLGQQIENR